MASSEKGSLEALENGGGFCGRNGKTGRWEDLPLAWEGSEQYCLRAKRADLAKQPVQQIRPKAAEESDNSRRC